MPPVAIPPFEPRACAEIRLECVGMELHSAVGLASCELDELQAGGLHTCKPPDHGKSVVPAAPWTLPSIADDALRRD